MSNLGSKSQGNDLNVTRKLLLKGKHIQNAKTVPSLYLRVFETFELETKMQANGHAKN